MVEGVGGRSVACAGRGCCGGRLINGRWAFRRTTTRASNERRRVRRTSEHQPAAERPSRPFTLTLTFLGRGGCKGKGKGKGKGTGKGDRRALACAYTQSFPRSPHPPPSPIDEHAAIHPCQLTSDRCYSHSSLLSCSATLTAITTTTTLSTS